VKGTPSALAFSPDSRHVAVASNTSTRTKVESELTIWDVSSGREVNRLTGKNDEVSSLQYGLEGRALLIGTLQ
jgi:WD40 repeat protein